MKKKWEEFNKLIDSHADDLQNFVNNVTDPVTVSNLKKLVAGYNRVLTGAETFGLMVQPISPVSIRIPFESEEFKSTWQDYKDYLLEDHQISFNSRREQYMLNCLKKWSDKSQSKAIEIIEFFIINGYRKFFSPNESQLTGKELPPDEANNNEKMDSTIDKSRRV